MKPTMTTKQKIKVQQIGSPARRDSKQELYLKSIGLGRKMNRVVEIENSYSNQALIKKVQHLVKVL